jgi:hypothetical protein
MKTYTQDQLQEIIAKHQLWLCGEECGERADLRYANLSSADLSFANLSSANLSSANLSSANLSSANLSSANLRYANLRYANLRYANLRYANLRYANLSSADDILCVGNMTNIKSVQADIWPVAYTCDEMQIGCQRHTLAEWWSFGDDEISRMDGRALDWWKVWKPILQAMIAASPAEPTGYVEKEGNEE